MARLLPQLPALTRALILSVVVLPLYLFLAGCPPLTEEGRRKEKEKFDSTTRQSYQDLEFQAFTGRLRQAVAAKDYRSLTAMMTNDFGFDLYSDLVGPGYAFVYWNEYDLWDDLQRTLDQEFRNYDQFLVAPKEFAYSPEEFQGPRAGILNTRRGYRFAYFVDGEGRDLDAGASPIVPSAPSDATPRSGTLDSLPHRRSSSGVFPSAADGSATALPSGTATATAGPAATSPAAGDATDAMPEQPRISIRP